MKYEYYIAIFAIIIYFTALICKTPTTKNVVSALNPEQYLNGKAIDKSWDNHKKRPKTNKHRSI